MAGNTSPLFTKQANVSSVALTAANTSSQGGGVLGTNIFKVWTPDVTNGGFLRFVRLMPTATAPLSMTATVLRLFLSTVTTPGTATTSANTFLWKEINVGSPSADSASSANNEIDVPLNEPIPAGMAVLGTTHAAPAANTAWVATGFGGDY